MSWYNILGGHSGSDEYYTPSGAAKMLFPYLPKKAILWEACWGAGHLARALTDGGFQVVGGPEIKYEQRVRFAWDICVTNPPFSLKYQFLDLTYWRAKPFAILLPLDTLVHKPANRLFKRYGVRLLIPNKRINFIRGTTNTKAANFNSAWFCWGLDLPQPINFVEAPW